MDFSGIEKLSLLDYDSKIACTLFVAGCPFRCPFCHNSSLVLNPEEAGTIPWDEIYSFLQKRAGIVEAVVITGGEPTIMPDLIDKIKQIKELGYEIKLDTNGSNPKVLKEIVNNKLVDYIAMDIKNSKEKYLQTIGLRQFDLSKIEESVQILINSSMKYEFRTTIIEEFHKEEDFKSIARWIKGCYKFRMQKYVDRDGCIEHNFHAIKKETAARYLSIINDYVNDVQLRGY